MSNRTSHCFCGSVELAITGDPRIQAYCHCTDCRAWLSAPIHAAALFPSADVKVVKGADQVAMYKKTEASQRHFCKSCGSGVYSVHPQMGMTDVPAVAIEGLDFQPTMHVWYSEKVVSVRDGLPKCKAFDPKESLPE